jgi:squalene cyclase
MKVGIPTVVIRLMSAGESHVVQTSYAMMAPMQASVHVPPPYNESSYVHEWQLHKQGIHALHRGAQCLMKLQMPDGDWPIQSIIGAAVSTVGMTYSNYKHAFSIWALRMYKRYVLLGEPPDL